MNRIQENKRTGFYIDVGAHHPIRFSNTFFYYKKGWSGINIDAMPGSMKIFDKVRPRDINIEVPIAGSETEIDYFMFNEPALNGFSEEISLERNSLASYKIIAKKKLKTATLKSILDKHVKPGTTIDFLNIDVEGLDFEVLKSNDWHKYRPKFVLIEILTLNFEEIMNNEVFKFLKDKNYTLVSKAHNTCIFGRNDSGEK